MCAYNLLEKKSYTSYQPCLKQETKTTAEPHTILYTQLYWVKISCLS